MTKGNVRREGLGFMVPKGGEARQQSRELRGHIYCNLKLVAENGSGEALNSQSSSQ